MILQLLNPFENVLGFILSGKLHDEDYKTFVPATDAAAGTGKVLHLAQLHDFEGWDLHALWDVIKFGTTHCTKFGKISLVGDKTRAKWMAAVSKPFTMAKVRYIDTAAMDAAWAWPQEA